MSRILASASITARFLCLLLITAKPVLVAAQLPSYKNKNLSPQARAADLLRRMTVDEKLMQLQCMWSTKASFINAGAFNEAAADSLLKNGLGELARINETAAEAGYRPAEGAALYNRVQKFFVEKTRLGIPVMVHEESLHGQQSPDATNFPVPIALASSWNEGLMTEIYTAVAEEVRSRGAQHVLAPVVDVVRDPRWGRTEETMGEDPFLISKLAVAQVKAYQGSGVYLSPNKVAVTLKHFGVHGQSEGGINVAPSNVDERTAREVFFKPFEACVKAGAMNVMATYNELWGLPAHANRKLLHDILRREWGFRGLVVSDYGAVGDISTLHKVAPSVNDAGLMALKAGVDMETPDPAGYKNLKGYLSNGKLSLAEIDTAVMRVLVTKFRTGLFDNPYIDTAKAESIVGNAAKRAIAYKAATEGLVLLKNDGAFLPLDKSKIKTIAFIGPNADKCLLGGYSSIPRVCVSPLQAVKERHGKNITVLHAEGVRLTDRNNWFADSIQLVSKEDNTARIAEAVDVARRADVVVLFVGGNQSMSREGWSSTHLGDLPTLELLAGQQQLIDAVVATGKPVCAFVNSGPPLSIGRLMEAVPAVMQCWYLGQEGGYAMVDALFGDVNPSGKLPITFPRSAGHIPAYYNHKPSARRGYHLGFEVSPLFAFGHGLSYTSFQYGAPQLSSTTMKTNGAIQIAVEVKNTGTRRGAEVVQLYLRDNVASVTRPVQELKGFQKLWLDAGQAQTVTFTVTPELLKFYDKDMKWVLEPGSFTAMVGGSSANTQSVTFTVVE